MKLYFINSANKKKLVSSAATADNANKLIIEYIKKINPEYKVYYTRSWIENNETWYDVGSHTEFFLLTERDYYGNNSSN